MSHPIVRPFEVTEDGPPLQKRYSSLVGRSRVTTSVSTEHITDDAVHDRISTARSYALMVLRPTPEYFEADCRPIVWEHGRRNMALQAAGIMPIVCPVGDDKISGIAIFTASPEQARAIMADDPGVRAGIFTAEVHACLGFPGDALPA